QIGAGGSFGGRSNRLWGRDRSAPGGGSGNARTSAGGLSGTSRVRGGAGRTIDPDGESRIGALCATRGRLRVGVRTDSVASPAAGDSALAGRHVRSGPRGLLGQPESGPSGSRLPGGDPAECVEDRRRQNVAAGCGSGNQNA